jgi:hypothetical protein
VIKIKPAGFFRSLDDIGSNGFTGSPITTFHCCLGHVGGVTLTSSPQFSERVTGNLVARVFGPDGDNDRLNDAVDPDPGKPDADGDGFPDYWEAKKGTSPRDKSSHPPGRCCPGAPDADGDGHSDPQEIAGKSDPNDPGDVPDAKPDSPIRVKPGGGGGGGGGDLPPPPGCTVGAFLYECHVMLSISQTQAMADSQSYWQSFTTKQLLLWCQKLLRSGLGPNALAKCVGPPASIAATSLSFARALQVATANPPKCLYYYALKRRVIPYIGSWSDSWKLGYDPIDYLYLKGERTTYGGRTFACGQR